MRKPSLVLLLALGCVGFAAAPCRAQSQHAYHHSFADAKHWSQVFDDPQRDAWQKPHQVIEALALKPDAAVADLGSGTGYFSVRLAHFVPLGRVYGVDIEPDMVKYLAARAKRDGLANLSAVAGAPDDARLPGKVDLVLVVDTYHHIELRERYFRKLARSLKPAGRVAIIDFNSRSAMGPPPGARIESARVVDEMSKAGYRLVAEHHFLPEQYFLIFELKPAA